MENKILGGPIGFVQFSNFIYVTYCHLACSRHLWLVKDGIRLFVGGCGCFEVVVGGS